MRYLISITRILVVMLAGLTAVSAQSGSERFGGFVQGTVRSVNGTIVEIEGNVKIDVANAKFFSLTRSNTGPLPILPGMLFDASIIGVTSDRTRPLRADEVTLSLPDEAEFVANIQSIDFTNRTLRVFGEEAFTNSATDFRKKNFSVGDLSDFRPGQTVQIKLREEQGRLFVSQLFASDDRPMLRVFVTEAGVFDIKGTQISILNGKVILDSSAGQLTPDQLCDSLPASQFRPNARLGLMFTWLTDDGRMPLKVDRGNISIANEGEFVVADIQGFDPATNTLTLFNQPIKILGTTEIRKMSGKRGKIKDLKAGSRATVTFVVSDGQLLARKIVVTKREPGDLIFSIGKACIID